MLEQWILNQLAPLKGQSLIILRDPQRLIQAGAQAVDGWAEDNDYVVLFCAGNLALRELYETLRDEPDTSVLVVDRSRETARIPLFYPDLAAKVDKRHWIKLSLRDFLVEATNDTHWPLRVDERDLSRLLLANLDGALQAHENLRQISDTRFTDTDLYRIALGAKLNINPFRQLSVNEVRRLCVEQHRALKELDGILPSEVMDSLRQAIAKTPRPFCWLLDRDPELVIRSFTLSAIMHQHGLDHRLLLTNLDPALHDYRDISPSSLKQAMSDQLTADPVRVLEDVADAEAFLLEEPQKRLAFLLQEQMELDDPAKALAALQHEHLSMLVRSLALVSLLCDLIANRKLKFHRKVIDLLNEQASSADMPVLRRPTEAWQVLETTYGRAFEIYELTAKLAGYTKALQVKPTQDLDFDTFDKLWNEDRLNRLDYYLSDLERSLRLANMLPVPVQSLWPQLRERWEQARIEFKSMAMAVGQAQNAIDRRFQDLYLEHYPTWIQQAEAPVVFTHQFLPRMLQAHWDPQSQQKAVILVFDGLRTDAWDEFLRPVFEERYDVIESKPGSAILPTETQLSRKAISAGCLPDAFTSQRELNLLQVWLRQKMGLDLKFEVVHDDDSIASGISIRYVSDKLEYIVFNFSDKNLHNNDQELALIYGTTVSTIIGEDVRSVLRELPDDALIFVTSDHGFIPVSQPTVVIPDSVVVDTHDIKYRNARVTSKLVGSKDAHVVNFGARQLHIPEHSPTKKAKDFGYVLFPRPGYTLRRPHGHRPADKYTHGGLSLAECMVPMVVLGPRLEVRNWLIIEAVKQVGSVSEDETLTLEIVVVPTKIGLDDIAVSLTFSTPEIPARKEIFAGRDQTYVVRWTPKLSDITDADRQRGETVFPVTAILSYRQENDMIRVSRTVDVRVKLEPSRVRRRLDSKLDFLMGKVPKTLQ